MTGLSAALSNIARYRRGMEGLHTGAGLPRGLPADGGRVQEVTGVEPNPGALRMLCHVPADLPRGAALVVVLHGCGQTAEGYAAGAGWIELADRFGFALLLPEQRRASNSGCCFNWFQPEDTTRGHGEAASVHAMVQHMLTTHGLNAGRVFVTGLSAGGAFANALLATYPEVFSGGAIVAGLPFGAATNTQTALDAMYRGRQRSDRDWGNAVRAAAGHRGAWPRVSVWHGMADTTVIPVNGTDIVRQWLDVHGLAYAAATRHELGGATHLAWTGADGRAAVEMHTFPQLTHGVPISARDADPDQRCGTPAPYILEAGVSSSYRIAQSWGLIGQRRKTAPHATAPEHSPGSIAGIIHTALSAAGLTSR